MCYRRAIRINPGAIGGQAGLTQVLDEGKQD